MKKRARKVETRNIWDGSIRKRVAGRGEREREEVWGGSTGERA